MESLLHDATKIAVGAPGLDLRIFRLRFSRRAARKSRCHAYARFCARRERPAAMPEGQEWPSATEISI